jgi:hypothetical protein
MDQQPATPAGRTCGTCTLCCKILSVPEIDKPEGRWCPHVRQGKGCGIYAERPRQCRTFDCLWLLDPALGPEWKPEKAKFVFSKFDKTRLVAVCDPAAPNAWRGPAYYPQFKRWAQLAAQIDRQVLVHSGRKLTVVMPGNDVELMDVAPGDEIITHKIIGPLGFTLTIEHKRKAG